MLFPRGGNDLPIIYFRNNDPRSGFLELKRFEKPIDWMKYDSLTAANAISIEPEIPFEILPIEDFAAKRQFDLAFVCQSPGFTPKQSDQLLLVLQEYLEFDILSDIIPVS